jgi:CheY-like chemotaxis protein
LLQGPDRFDMLLSDVMMPRMDGMELVRAIRADEHLKDLQIILLSARSGADGHVEALQQGASEYLKKPFSSKELIVRTNRQLQLASVRIQLEEEIREQTAQVEQERESFRRLGELLHVGIHRSDSEGNVIWANAKCKSVLGLGDQLDDWEHIIAPEDRERAREAYVFCSYRVTY